MDRAAEITPGAIKNIYQTGNASSYPVVQIVELKKISHTNSTNAPPRYRLAISDSTHFQQAMIATQLNILINEKKLAINSLVRVKEVICNAVQGKKIVIILNLEVVCALPAKVGNPVSIDLSMNGQQQQGNGFDNNQNQIQNQNQNQNQNPTHNNAPDGNGYGQQQQQPQQAQKGYGQNGFGSNSYGGQQPNGLGAQSGATPQSSGGGFGGGSWKPSNMQQNPYSSTGAISKMNTTPTTSYRPIKSINPYQNGWTIRGRCSYKSDMRTFMNSRGEGKVVSFELTDDSGSIRITGFTQKADMINETVHMNKIYKVSRGSLKQANEKYNRSTSTFEMTLDRNSLLEEIPDDGTCLQIKYNFSKIAQLERIDVKGNCDVVGVVTTVAPLSEITLRSSGEPCAKRSVTIADDSNLSVELTLWRKQAETFLTEDMAARNPILLIRNAQRGDFGGVSLNVSRMTTLELDPTTVQEANKLAAWRDAGGLNGANVQSVTAGMGGGGGKVMGPRKSLEEARIEDVDPVFTGGEGGANASTMFCTRSVISFINTKNELYYPGDPETKKKVIDQMNGSWLSESSGRQLSEAEVSWRYLISMKIMDYSGAKWVSGFDEIGQVLFGREGRQLRDMYHNDRQMFDNILDDIAFRPLVMRVQVKERTWKDEQQIRYTVSRVEWVNFAEEGHAIYKEIEGFGAL